MGGWTYARSGKHQSDPTLECSREVTPACSKIIVELQGAAKEKWPEFAGSYLPVKGKINRGRWVLQHSSGSDEYLRVPTGSVSWGIGPDIDGEGAWIQSGSAGGICPAQASNSRSDRLGVKSWEYADDGLKEGI